MQRKLPAGYTLMYSEDAIQRRVSGLAHEIRPWIEAATQASKNELLAVCILRGGALLFADLVRQLPETIETAYCRAKSYNDNAAAADFSVQAEDLHVLGRPVLLVDDICESGRTLAGIEALCRKQGATEVKTVVLVDREQPKRAYQPQWAAFRYNGPEWFVGYGMDDRNHYSNLPHVYVIREVSTKS